MAKSNLTLIFILWIGFHSLALLMAFTEIDNFNVNNDSAKEDFWPFVKFTYTQNVIDPSKKAEYDERYSEWTQQKFLSDLEDKMIRKEVHSKYLNKRVESASQPGLSEEESEYLLRIARKKTPSPDLFLPVGDLTIKKTYFNGIFFKYDWTEFLFYVGLALFVVFIKRFSNTQN
jgi:hypothetical protein